MKNLVSFQFSFYFLQHFFIWICRMQKELNIIIQNAQTHQTEHKLNCKQNLPHKFC